MLLTVVIKESAVDENGGHCYVTYLPFIVSGLFGVFDPQFLSSNTWEVRRD